MRIAASLPLTLPRTSAARFTGNPRIPSCLLILFPAVLGKQSKYRSIYIFRFRHFSAVNDFPFLSNCLTPYRKIHTPTRFQYSSFYYAHRAPYTVQTKNTNPSPLLEEPNSDQNNCTIANALKTYGLVHSTEQQGLSGNELIRVSMDHGQLLKAYDFALPLLEDEDPTQALPLISELCIKLAEANMAVPASTVLRTLVQIGKYLPVDFMCRVIDHMTLTQSGACLASQLVLEFGSVILEKEEQNSRSSCDRSLLRMKPNTIAFNIAMEGCLKFGMTHKAEELIELLPKVGAKPDVSCYSLMALVFQRNGRRDELKKLTTTVEEFAGVYDHRFRQVYNSLLHCHLDFGDLDAASKLILDMLRQKRKADVSSVAAKAETKTVSKSELKIQNANSVSSLTKSELQSESGSQNHQIQLPGVGKEEDSLLSCENQTLKPTQKAFAKLVKGYIEANRVMDLSDFLIQVHHLEAPVSVENSLSTQVINACIELGWIDEAHDIVDEMRLASIPTGSQVYSSLLKAYCKARRPREAVLLLRQLRKEGIPVDASFYDAVAQLRMSGNDMEYALPLLKEMRGQRMLNSSNTPHLRTDDVVKKREPELMLLLLAEVRDNKEVSVRVQEWNSIIHIFCRTGLMEDAKKAYQKMKDRGYQPNAQTFHSLIRGFLAAEGMYKEIPELWADMKRLASPSSETGAKPLKLDQDLLDAVLYGFIRGGFFGRALEVMSIMEESKLFIDKVRCRQVYLKHHRTLYKNKNKTAPTRHAGGLFTKREQVMAFKQWVGLDQVTDIEHH